LREKRYEIAPGKVQETTQAAAGRANGAEGTMKSTGPDVMTLPLFATSNHCTDFEVSGLSVDWTLPRKK
jgi:hypothetical protein